MGELELLDAVWFEAEVPQSRPIVDWFNPADSALDPAHGGARMAAP